MAMKMYRQAEQVSEETQQALLAWKEKTLFLFYLKKKSGHRSQIQHSHDSIWIQPKQTLCCHILGCFIWKWTYFNCNYNDSNYLFTPPALSSVSICRCLCVSKTLVYYFSKHLGWFHRVLSIMPPGTWRAVSSTLLSLLDCCSAQSNRLKMKKLDHPWVKIQMKIFACFNVVKKKSDNFWNKTCVVASLLDVFSMRIVSVES